MARQQGWFAIIIALIVAAAAVCINFPLQLGLDLKGGSLLTLQVQPTEEIKNIDNEQLEAVKAVMDLRVNGLGVSESTIQSVGNNKLVVQLPGEQDPVRAAEILGSTALLEFRAQKAGTNTKYRDLQNIKVQVEQILSLKNNPNDLTLGKDQVRLDSSKILLAQKLLGIDNPPQNETEQLIQILERSRLEIANLFDKAYFTGNLIKAGSRQVQNGSSWEVTLTFNKIGGDKFAELTKSLAGTGRLLGIVLDGRSISEASVGEQFKVAGITGGSASITGNFSVQEARDLEVKLDGGSLPLPVEILQVRTIGPTLGEENVRRSLLAALSGLILVAFFMIFVYRLAGLVAVIALSLYSLFNLSVYSLLPVTLTLPGIAGFILSIGMAVDANVLIFERVKDELRRGNTLIRSIETGFSQAVSSILDGHLTTLISCIALFSIGTGFVKGFAATLGIGVILSLFTALTCTRTILKFLMSYQSLRKASNFISASQIPNTSN
tara:strand:- start:2698 stop:4179 length:1482 start_codon:yes stop_codon:yes gene_type:complete